MRKFISNGLMVIAGVVSLPVGVSSLGHGNPAPDYRNDPRLRSLRRFFDRFHCPAWKYAPIFLEAADRNELDWRLLPSLSFIESTGGKSARGNNYFGWNEGRSRFLSPSEAIHTVGFYLSHSDHYRDKDLDAVLNAYNPNEEYGAKVKSVMRRISPAE